MLGSNIQSLEDLMLSINCKFDIDEIETAITKEIFKTTLSKKYNKNGKKEAFCCFLSS
jgi:hypothetical protein